MLCAIRSVQGFSLLMPPAAWQVPGIGYQVLPGDLGGVANLGEEYRWNIPTIYYAYDESFLNYFGTEGTNQIEKAIAILNALPAVSQMSSNLAEFPTETARVNYRAAALGLTDLKSTTLQTLLEELGLANPQRFVWCLRQKLENPNIYTVIKRNFDPVTFLPSSFVNGTLYTYVIQDPVAALQLAVFADAVELQVDPLQLGYTAVAGSIDNWQGTSPFTDGTYYTGVTRDDVGGLRYLYRPTNYQFENIFPGATASTTGSPWTPVGGTNATSTNNVVDLAVRPGVDKITFKLAKYDSMVGAFITVTNTYTDKYVTNSTVKTQSVQRVLIQPDILFQAEDLGPTAGGFQALFARTDTAGWVNNDALNGQATLDGPGVIQPQVVLTYSKLGPYFVNQDPIFLDEFTGITGFIWGAFDGTTNEPVVFPVGSSIQELEQQVLFGGGGGGSLVWTVPNSGGTTNAP